MWKWFQRLCWPPKAAEPTESTISSTSECKTYRVQGVPIRCDKAKLEQILNKEPDKKNFKIKSLVLEYHGRHQTATVDALDGAELPAYINVSSATSQAADRPEIQLQTDDNFHGLTTLFAPLEEEHEVDVVAICGLGGHAIGSFRHRESHHIWLRDALPHDLTAEHSDRPMARLMTYGYESKVAGSKNTQQLGDLASGLRETLGALQGSRPLIFIAHSLGGLIIKEAIISLNKLDTTEYNMLLQRIRGIIFFAVPHAGMNIESMVSMVGGGYNLSLVVSLSDVNSKVLDDQRVEFKKALDNKKNIEVFCFYELLASPTAIKVAADKWELRGEEEVLLKKTSATDCRSGGDGLDHVCPIRASHSNIVKFRQNDPEYDRALHKIKEVCYRALGARDIPPVQDVHFIVPYPRNRSFVGRKKVLTKIKETLELRKRPEARKYTKLALHGLGGIGKTQIAIAFAYWVRDKYQHISVLWVHASSEDRFRRAYEKIAKAYNIPGHNDPRTDILVLVRDYLTLKERKQWIMIIDNADDSELFFSSGADDMGMPSDRGLSQYIPNCAHGTTLLTTRTKKAGLNFVPGQGHLLIEIGVLEPDGARQLVQQTLGSDKVTADQASSLSESLENLPLALAQALAYMEANSMAIEEYQTLLREGEVVLVDQFCQHFPSDKRDEDMPNAVAAAWVISFEQISKTDPLAAEFLSIMSLLDRQAILEDFFVTYQSQKRKSNPSKRWEYEDKKARIESLSTLIAYSFITKSMQNTYDMHRLVHLVTRRWLVQKGMFDKFASLATSIMLDACPQPVWDNIGLFAKILPHTRAVVGHQAVLEGAFIERAEILYRMGWYLLRTSQLADAERCTAESQRLFEEHLGASHHDTLWAFHLRLQIYTDQGKFPEAVTLAEEALAQAQDGDDGAILAITRISASVYRRMGNLEKAEEKLQSCLKTAKAKLGDEHDQTLFCLHALAQVHIDQGRLNESQTILDVVIAARKRLKGNEHLDTLATMHDLARLHACRGKFQDAAELNKRVWQLRTYKLGDDNAHTLASQNNYACNLRSLGRHHTAVEVMQDCELRQIRVWGPDHPKALIAQSLVQQWSVQVNSHGLQH